MIQRILAAATLLAALHASEISAATVDLTTATMAGPDAHLHGSLTDEAQVNPGSFSILKSLPAAGGVYEFRGYLVFNVSGIQGHVSDAALLLPNGTLSTEGQQSGLATIQLRDFYSPVTEIFNHPTKAMFDDLGAGILYGENSEFSTSAPPTTVRIIPLNVAAITAINSPIDGRFMMGVSISSEGQQAPWFRWLNLTRDVRNITLRLTVIPEPTAAMLAASAVIGLAALRRRAVTA
ncbi:hypothetical protein PLANPX_2671 [Lacipirellula parvula]|uniref:PEP-CTERM protein-sorting domain-containing protein n=2 Tax=Lacipirellula parvula TaxID=2650471 RepID=A0A5K7XJK4_9BACT|nr:hypothetical protein PLANPX_2671 [Lacipirellula parvula]